MKRYYVSKECIGCRACVGVAQNNFDINNNLAYVKKQPENNEEIESCEKAMEACPVNAIYAKKRAGQGDIKAVFAKSNIKETLDRYPELKQVLIELSPKFKRMQNTALYNTLARFANFNDAATISGLSICEILHTINKYLGTTEQLIKVMPECIQDDEENIMKKSVPVSWKETGELYIYNSDSMEYLIKKASSLPALSNLIVIARDEPVEFLKTIDGLGLIFNVEKNREYRISVFNPKEEKKSVPWQDRLQSFEALDVRDMDEDPFDVILKKAYEIKNDGGFVLIQRFEPYPIINMLSEMGFEHITKQVSEYEFRVYFHKKTEDKKAAVASDKKVDIVIQSATPVAYPVIMRLLQSEQIRNSINIKELKIWEETEKHLAWITNKKADISFSALITAAKLRNSDIKIPALFVWDNFVLLSRDKISGFNDIKGKKIYTPLFEEAPPAKITKYLIKASGLNPDEFIFVYGKPFGRPEEIYNDFVLGRADTVILREPEASYAIKIMKDRKQDISVLSYNEMWNKINPGFGSFPNAGVVLKGEFARKYPEIVDIFLKELRKAIDWVNNNKKDAAKLSFDMMRQPVDRIELFLDRVNFDYVDKEKLTNKVENYFAILNANDITNIEINDDFLKIFEL